MEGYSARLISSLSPPDVIRNSLRKPGVFQLKRLYDSMLRMGKKEQKGKEGYSMFNLIFPCRMRREIQMRCTSLSQLPIGRPLFQAESKQEQFLTRWDNATRGPLKRAVHSGRRRKTRRQNFAICANDSKWCGDVLT